MRSEHPFTRLRVSNGALGYKPAIYLKITWVKSRSSLALSIFVIKMIVNRIAQGYITRSALSHHVCTYIKATPPNINEFINFRAFDVKQ